LIVLILTRKAGEKIVIDGDITITVMEVGRGGQVRIGIDAPRHHRILRYELLAEIAAENRGAAVAPAGPVDISGLLANLPKPPPG
jgi:carbon storage regulator